MFGIFKKKSQLKYVEWANNNPKHIISNIILGMITGLKMAEKKPYSCLYSDYGIFELLILVFTTIHTFTHDTKEYDDIREALFENFLLISANNVFFVELSELEPLINNRGKRYSSLRKENNYELLYATVLSYCKMGALNKSLPKGSEYNLELDFLMSLEGELFVSEVFPVILEAIIKFIKDFGDKRK